MKPVTPFILATLLLLAPAIVSAADEPVDAKQQWGDFSGTFVYSGVQPAAKDESLVVDAKTGGLANVCVWLVAPKGKQLSIHPSYAETAQSTVNWKIAEQRYSPRVLTMRNSQTLKFINNDLTVHVPTFARADNPPQLPAIILAPDDESEYRPKSPTYEPAETSCSVERGLRGWLLVQDHPYVAVTDESGRFTIKNLPVGQVAVHFWHEQLGNIHSVVLGSESKLLLKGIMVTTIKMGNNNLGQIRCGKKLLK